jgi:hypothetical protein
VTESGIQQIVEREARKSILEMMGEALREIAVLVAVFAPLDRWVEHRAYTWTDTWRTMGFGAILFALGAVFERLRPIR